MSEKTNGHVCALVTILIWGTTFISTKVLLDTLTPLEILFGRFLLGYLALLMLPPRGCAASPFIFCWRTWPSPIPWPPT